MFSVDDCHSEYQRLVLAGRILTTGQNAQTEAEQHHEGQSSTDRMVLHIGSSLYFDTFTFGELIICFWPYESQYKIEIVREKRHFPHQYWIILMAPAQDEF